MDYERDYGEQQYENHTPFETSHRIILSSNEWLNLNVGIGIGITNLSPLVHELARLFIISGQFLKRRNTVA